MIASDARSPPSDIWRFFFSSSAVPCRVCRFVSEVLTFCFGETVRMWVWGCPIKFDCIIIYNKIIGSDPVEAVSPLNYYMYPALFDSLTPLIIRLSSQPAPPIPESRENLRATLFVVSFLRSPVICSRRLLKVSCVKSFYPALISIHAFGARINF